MVQLLVPDLESIFSSFSPTMMVALSVSPPTPSLEGASVDVRVGVFFGLGRGRGGLNFPFSLDGSGLEE